jgi:hypothetical protein
MKSKILKTKLINAISNGKKSQFREVVKGIKIAKVDNQTNCVEVNPYYIRTIDVIISQYSKYKVGEIIFVKEKFQTGKNIRDIQNIPLCEDENILYYEKEKNSSNINNREYCEEIKWKNAISMSEKDARFGLKIKNIKIEALNDISEEDLVAEGCPYELYRFDWFEGEWNVKNDKGFKVENNPFVFVYDFEVVKINL